jgi:heat shock protein HslJ
MIISRSEKMTKIALFAFGSIALLSLAACSVSASSQNLTGSIWLLSELNGQAPITGTAITSEFDDDGRVGGSSGCNNYSTTYEVNGDQITFGESMASTMMACPEPIMEQERDYLQVLANTTTFEIMDDELILEDSSGNVLARFYAVSQSLEGTSWQVLSYNNGKGGVVSLIIGTEISANFGEDGQLTGNSGCNNYFAEYETDGDKISIGPAGATEMACLEPEGVMEQEGQYLAALGTADSYKIQGLNMEMRTSDGALVASFQREISP